MIFVVEGPRGSGKTTFCNALLDELQMKGLYSQIYKAQRSDSTEPSQSPFVGMQRALMEQSEHPNVVFIWDRAHLTEYVMSLYLDRMNPKELLVGTQYVDNWLYIERHTCFVLTANKDTILRRVNERKDGRKLDMPIDLVHPIWRSALSISKLSQEFVNNTEFDFEIILRAAVRSVEWMISTRAERN